MRLVELLGSKVDEQTNLHLRWWLTVWGLPNGKVLSFENVHHEEALEMIGGAPGSSQEAFVEG